MLRTERLVLRPWRVTDAAFQHLLWSERDPRVPAHRRLSPDGHPTVAELGERLRRYRQEPCPGLLVIEREDGGGAIGYCGLVASQLGDADEPELAYELRRSAHGQGHATEAGAAVVGLARELGHRSLASTVRAWNGPSLRVLDRLGFSDTGERIEDAAHGDTLVLRKVL